MTLGGVPRKDYKMMEPDDGQAGTLVGGAVGGVIWRRLRTGHFRPAAISGIEINSRSEARFG